MTQHAVPAGWVATGLRVPVGTGPIQSLSCLFSVLSLSSKSCQPLKEAGSRRGAFDLAPGEIILAMD